MCNQARCLNPGNSFNFSFIFKAKPVNFVVVFDQIHYTRSPDYLLSISILSSSQVSGLSWKKIVLHVKGRESLRARTGTHFAIALDLDRDPARPYHSNIELPELRNSLAV